MFRTPWFSSNAQDGAPSAEQLSVIGRLVGVPVEFDQTGWLSEAIELRVACNRLECVLTPRSIRVSRDSPVRELIEQGGVLVRCQRYNEVIRDLRRLLCMFDEAMTRRRPSPEAAPDFYSSHTELRLVQRTALERLDQTTNIGVITLHALDIEIAYFERCHRFYQRVLDRFELSSAVTPPLIGPNPWDEDTLDPWQEDEP